MKIDFNNGSKIESLDVANNTRGIRSKNIEYKPQIGDGWYCTETNKSYKYAGEKWVEEKYKNNTDIYYVLITSYDSKMIIKTNCYNEDIEYYIQWLYGSSYCVDAVFKSPEEVSFENWYVNKTKEDILDDIECKKLSWWFDEEGEELESKIKEIVDKLV